jgi:DNA-binding NarL/FixJ family response regulator
VSEGTALPRIIIADESAEMRKIILDIIGVSCQLVGVASDGRTAINAALRHRPDILLIDVFMPDIDGLQVTRRLCTVGAGCRIIIVTILEDRDYVKAALSEGAAGYVFKRRMVRDLLPAIGEVMAGRVFVSGHPS